jgi:hypothetical protein
MTNARTMYRRRTRPPVKIAARTHRIRTTVGSTSRYSAMPPAMPVMTRSVRLR